MLAVLGRHRVRLQGRVGPDVRRHGHIEIGNAGVTFRGLKRVGFHELVEIQEIAGFLVAPGVVQGVGLVGHGMELAPNGGHAGIENVYCLVGFALAQIEIAEVVVGVRIGRLELDGPPVAGRRLAFVSGGVLHGAEVHPVAGVGVVDGDRAGQHLDGGRMPSRRMLDHGQTAEGIGVIRLEGEHAAVDGGGLPQAFLAMEGHRRGHGFRQIVRRHVDGRLRPLASGRPRASLLLTHFLPAGRLLACPALIPFGHLDTAAELICGMIDPWRVVVVLPTNDQKNGGRSPRRETNLRQIRQRFTLNSTA